jgi:drug/metabolite transporter (DMT)-like permease
MLGDDLSSGKMLGNLIAFLMPISFAVLIIIVRKYPKVDMIPLQLIAGIVAMIIGYLMSGRIDISYHDIFLGFVAGFFQLGFGFIFITIGARTTPSAAVGIIMLSEAIFGPLWAWMFINEKPSLIVLIGGSIVLSAVLLQFLNKFFTKKEIV